MKTSDFEATEKNYRVMEDFTSQLNCPDNPSKSSIKENDSILLLRLSAIGDVVRGLPLANYIRSKGFTGTLSWAVQPPCDQFLKEIDMIDRVHRIDRKKWWRHPFRLWEQLKSISREDYDWVFDLHALAKSGVVSWSSRSERRIGFHPKNNREGNQVFQTETIDALAKNLPRILKYVQLVRPFLKDKSLRRDDLVPSFTEDFHITDPVRKASDENPILIHPRTSHDRYGRLKEWRSDNFVKLLNQMRKDPNDYPPVYLTWGPGEKETAQKIAEQQADFVKISPETPNLSNLFHLIHSASLVVSGDTGPCHIADVASTPLVALFGASNYFVSGPILTNYRLVTPWKANERNTDDIPVERVHEAVSDLWSQVENQ